MIINKLLKVFTSLVWTALILFLLLVGTTFLPIPGNYKAYTVQSGSMEPEIRLGSLIFVKPSADYKVNDIATFQVQGGKTTVTHRIMEKKEVGGEILFTMKGDANEESDTQEIKKSALVGKVFLTLPLLGFPIGYAKTKLGFILLILIPSIIIIYEELRGMAGEIKKKFLSRRRSEAKKSVREEEALFCQAEENIRIRDYNFGLKSVQPCQPPPHFPIPKRKIV